MRETDPFVAHVGAKKASSWNIYMYPLHKRIEVGLETFFYYFFKFQRLALQLQLSTGLSPNRTMNIQNLWLICELVRHGEVHQLF